MKELFIAFFTLFYSLGLLSQSEELNNSNPEIIITDDKISCIHKKLRNETADLLSAASVSDAYVNGREYYPYFNTSLSSPLFKTEANRIGSLFCSGTEYDSLNLHYDTYIDGIILLNTNNEGSLEMILLNDNYIDSFRLDFSDHSILFQKKALPTGDEGEILDAFFHIPYNGRIKYMVRHKSYKVIYDSQDRYEYEPAEYICRDSVLYQVRSHRSFLKLFEKDERNKIKKFMKKNHIRLSRKEMTPEITSVLEYYDSIR